MFVCDTCAHSVNSERGYRRHLLSRHGIVFHRKGQCETLGGEDLQGRLEPFRKAQKNSMLKLVARACADRSITSSETLDHIDAEANRMEDDFISHVSVKKDMIHDEPKMFRPSIHEKTLSKFDEEIEQTLHSDKTDVEKAHLYIDTLTKHKYYDVCKPAPKPVTEDHDINSTSTQVYSTKLLLNYIKSDPTMKFAEDGSLICTQRRVPDCNIIDLVIDAIHDKAEGDLPRGWKEFAECVKSVNTPLRLIAKNNLKTRPKRLRSEQRNRPKAINKRGKFPTNWEEY